MSSLTVIHSLFIIKALVCIQAWTEITDFMYVTNAVFLGLLCPCTTSCSLVFILSLPNLQKKNLVK